MIPMKPCDFFIDGWANLDWLKDVLEDRFAPNLVADLTVKELGSDHKDGVKPKEGFMASIRRVFIRWKGEAQPTESVIVKMPNMRTAQSAFEKSSSAETSALEEHGARLVMYMHDNESAVYRIFEKTVVEGFRIPKVYLNRNSDSEDPREFPVIVMEDLSRFEIADVVEGLDEAKLFSVVDFLVELHYFSLHSNAFADVGMTEEQVASLVPFETLVHGMCEKLKHDAPELFSNLPLAEEHVLSSGDWFDDYMKLFKSGGNVAVLTHGDLWTTNVLFDGDSVGGIIDWQVAHPGSPTEDLQHLLTTCCSVEMRKKLTEPLLEYYFEKLSAKYAKNGEKIPFDYVTLKDLYKTSLPYTMAMSVFATGMWSTSDVILVPDGKVQKRRLQECYERTASVIEETLISLGIRTTNQ